MTTALRKGCVQRSTRWVWGVCARGVPSVRSHRRHEEAPAGGQHAQEGVHHRPSQDGAHGTARRATVRSKAWRAKGSVRATAHRDQAPTSDRGEAATPYSNISTVPKIFKPHM